MGCPTRRRHAVWHRIREQAEAEGLIRRPAVRRHSTWYWAAASRQRSCSGCCSFRDQQELPIELLAAPEYTDNGAAQVKLTTLQTLMTESRRLETIFATCRLNHAYSASARPRQLPISKIASPRSTISSTTPRFTSPGRRGNIRRERARLMKLLVGMRFAQAQYRILNALGDTRK